MANGKIVIEAILDDSKVREGLNKISASTKGGRGGGVISSALGNLKDIAGISLALKGIDMALNAITGTVGEMVGELNDSMKAWKTFEGNMEILGKSKQEIDSARKSMQDYATKTIYSASEMASTYAQLSAIGIENTDMLVKGFGGLASAAENPKQAMKTLSQQATQMAGRPAVAWADFKLMLEQTPAGIAAVAKHMGMSTDEMVSAVQKGEIATKDFFNAITEVGNSDGFQKMATQYKSADQAMDGLKETLANKLMPAFTKLDDIAKKGIEKIISWIDKLDFSVVEKAIDKVIKVASEMGKVVGGALQAIYNFIKPAIPYIASFVAGILAFKTAVGVIMAVKNAFMLLKGALGLLSANPMMLLFGALAMVGYGLYQLYQNSEGFRNAVNSAFQSISEVAVNAWNSIKGAIEPVMQALSGAWKSVVSAFSNWWNSNQQGVMQTATSVWNAVLDVVKSVSDWFVGTFVVMFESFSSWWSANQESFMTVVSSVWNAISTTIGVMIEFVANLINAIWQPVSAWFIENQDLIRQTIVTVWNAILAVISFVMNYIVPFIVEGWNNIVTLVKPVLDYFVNIVSNFINLVLGIIKAVMQVLNGDWSGAWETIKETAIGYWNGMVSAVSEFINGIWTAITEVVGNILESWGTSWESIQEVASNVWEAISSAVSAGIESVKEFFTGGWEAVTEAWDSFWSGLSETIDEWVSGITDLLGPVVETISGIWNSVSEFTGNAWNGVTETVGGAWDWITGKTGESGEATVANAQATAQGVNDASSGVEDSVSHYDNLANGANSAVQGMSDSIPQAVKDIASNAKTEGEAVEKTKEYYNTLRDVSIKALQHMSGQINFIYTKLGQDVERTSMNMKSKVTAQFDAMRAGIQSKMNSIVSVTVSSMYRVVSAMYNASGQAWSAGNQMGAGFYNGLASMAGAIIGLAYSIANSAAAAMRSALRIKSPSRVTMAIGAFTGEGVVAGMASMIPKVIGVAHKMASAMIPDVSGVPLPKLPKVNPNVAMGLVGAYAGSVSNTNTVINRKPTLHVENFYNNSQDDTVKLMREMMWIEKQSERGGLG